MLLTEILNGKPVRETVLSEMSSEAKQPDIWLVKGRHKIKLENYMGTKWSVVEFGGNAVGDGKILEPNEIQSFTEQWETKGYSKFYGAIGSKDLKV